jgi:sialidase-1
MAWTDPVVVCSGEGTVGNPAPVEAADGDIVVLTTSNPADVDESAIIAGSVPPERSRRVHLSRFRADLQPIGRTEDITDQVKRPDWGWYATGPGHGIRLSGGRMVVAANHSGLGDRADGTVYGAHGLCSDDEGRSWRVAWDLSGIPGGAGPNESSLTGIDLDAEGHPRSALVTMRNEARADAATRIIARTALGAEELASAQVLDGFPGPRIQSGLCAAPDALGEGIDALLSAPVHPDTRRDLGLFAVIGDRCRLLGIVREGPCGYSDLACDGERVFVLVETGREGHHPHEAIDLFTIDVSTVAQAARTTYDRAEDTVKVNAS